jgi:EpsI family protein
MKNSYISSTAVNDLLKVDDYIHYTYQTNLRPPITLYIAYYESVGTGGGYHSPKNCLPGGGWSISEVKPFQLDTTAAQGGKTTVTEMIIRNRNEHQVVLYWYQNRGKTIYSEYWEKIHLVIDAILKGRRDGSFIRIMVYAPDGNIQETEREAKEFAESVYNELQQFIPGSSI